MMKFFPIVVANLGRHKRRTVLTTLSVALAMFLFASLRSFDTTLDTLVESGSTARMVVRNATGIVFPLPMSYVQRLAAEEGVRAVTWASWFGGTYRSERDFFASFAVEGPGMIAMYPEMVIPEDQKEAFLRDRTGALVGAQLMEKFGWRLGQSVTLGGSVYPGEWTFTIRAIYTVTEGAAFDEASFMFHYDYLFEATERRAMPGWFYLELTDPSRAGDVAATIDAQYKNSSYATRTETEKAFNAGWFAAFGNVRFFMNTIGIAVVFAILMVTGNAMMMSARERTGEIAVLKALGFGAGLLFALEMSEAVVVSAVGALVGLLGATVLWANVSVLPQFLPGFRVAASTLILGSGLALGLAVVSGLVPALRAYRLQVVEALRTVE